MTKIDTWIEAIGSMHMSGAELDNLFNAVPDGLRDEVKAEWDRRVKAYEESKDRPIEEIKAEVFSCLNAYRLQHLYAEIDALRAEVAMLRSQLAVWQSTQPHDPYKPWRYPVYSTGTLTAPPAKNMSGIGL